MTTEAVSRSSSQGDFSQSNPIISALESRFPKLRDLYRKYAGVGEGYTIGEHTEMVLRLAREFQETFRADVERLVSWDDFCTFLALHDIGKGLALEQNPKANSFAKKQAELRETCQIMQSSMAGLGVSPGSIRLFSQLLAYDTIGLYLKDEISQEEAFYNIVELAFKAGFEAHQLEDFFHLMIAFHSLDAASYPFVKHRFFQENGGRLQYCPDYQRKIGELRSDIQASVRGENLFYQMQRSITSSTSAKDYAVDSSKKFFIYHANDLSLFLKREHMKLLLANGNPKLREEFRRVEEGFRDLYLYFAKHSTEIEQLVENYEKWNKGEFGRRRFHLSDGVIDNINGSFFSNTREYYTLESENPLDDENSISDFRFRERQLKQLLFSVALFRRDYLCRYSIGEVASKAIDEIRDEQFDKTPKSLNKSEVDQLCKFNPDLLRITWLHGANSGILPCLPSTDHCLVPTGRLLQYGITPMSGELGNGAVPGSGVNNTALSGTRIDAYPMSWHYAESFNVDLSSLKQTVDEFKTKDESGKDCWRNFTNAKELTEVAFAIKRLKILDHKYVAPMRDSLLDKVYEKQQAWKAYQKTADYKKNMPKKLDPNGSLGYRHHDEYYSSKFASFDKALNFLEQTLQEGSGPSSFVMNWNEKTFPVLFGSTTLFSFPAQNDPASSEMIVRKSARLGDDVQLLITEDESISKLQEFAHHLDRRVEVVSIDLIKKAARINRYASKYLADIVSLQELKRIRDEARDKESDPAPARPIVEPYYFPPQPFPSPAQMESTQSKIDVCRAKLKRWAAANGRYLMIAAAPLAAYAITRISTWGDN